MDVEEINPVPKVNQTHPKVKLRFAYCDHLSLLPEKSKEKYQTAYDHFIEWLKPNEVKNITEEVMIGYMEHLSLTSRFKPSTIWTRYSMLKTTIYIKHNIDMSNFDRLKDILKKLQVGYTPKYANVLTPKNVLWFIRNAPDFDYLFSKVVLIFSLKGSCRRSELKKLTIDNITDLNSELVVKVSKRVFSIDGIDYKVVKKYMDLRPKGMKEFFLCYRQGKCTPQVAGINKLGKQAKPVAEFFKLESPKKYTEHRQSSPVTKSLETTETDSKIFVHNNFGISSQTSYESALETIAEKWMTDESQVFCNFVAGEMRDISNPELRQQMKKKIQKTVLEFLEKDAELS